MADLVLSDSLTGCVKIASGNDSVKCVRESLGFDRNRKIVNKERFTYETVNSEIPTGHVVLGGWKAEEGILPGLKEILLGVQSRVGQIKRIFLVLGFNDMR